MMIASMMVSLMLCSQVASAAPAGQADADAAARRAEAPGEEIAARYDFEQDQVDGDLLCPDHEPIRSRIGQRHEHMINLRGHFIPQMLQMANDV